MKLPTSARVGIGMMVLLWGTLAHVRKVGNVSRMAGGASSIIAALYFSKRY